MNPVFSPLLDELSKLGAVSDEEARQALDRLKTLEKKKPTQEQLARYAALGAAGGTIIGMGANVIKGKPAIDAVKGVRFGKTRALASDAAKGAAGASLLSLRDKMDRRSEKKKILENLKEKTSCLHISIEAFFEEMRKIAAMPPPTLYDPSMQNVSIPKPSGVGGWHQAREFHQELASRASKGDPRYVDYAGVEGDRSPTIAPNPPSALPQAPGFLRAATRPQTSMPPAAHSVAPTSQYPSDMMAPTTPPQTAPTFSKAPHTVVGASIAPPASAHPNTVPATPSRIAARTLPATPSRMAPGILRGPSALVH